MALFTVFTLIKKLKRILKHISNRVLSVFNYIYIYGYLYILNDASAKVVDHIY